MSTPETGGERPLIEQPPQPPADVLARPKPSEATAAGRIEYLESFRFVFVHPEWFKNLVILGVFTLIPVLNTLLLFGYLFEVVEHRNRRLEGPYPLFQPRRFAAYMTRGVWCYLLYNIVQIIIMPIVQVLTQGTMFGSMAAMQSGDWGAIGVAVVVPLLIIGFLLFLVAIQVLLTPLLMRGGLTQDFGLMMNFRWVGSYLRMMWIETTLVSLFVLLTTMIILPLGCLLLCYGFLVALALLTIVQGHLMWQLYELYLARGGEPIPMRPLQDSRSTT